MAEPPSNKPGRYRRLLIDQADNTKPIRGYRHGSFPDHEPLYYDPVTGRAIELRNYYSLPDATAADPTACGTPYTVKGINGQTHTIYISARGGMVERWHTNFGGGDKNWLFRGFGIFAPGAPWPPQTYNGGAGASIAWDEAMAERTAGPNTCKHNPTYQGGFVLPGFAHPEVSQIMSPTPWFQVLPNGQNSLVMQSGVIPLEFDSNGVLQSSTDHGGDVTHPVIWHTMRMCQRVTVNKFPNVHQVEGWSYQPDAWNSADGDGSYFYSTLLFLVDQFDSVYFINAITGQRVNVANWFQAPIFPNAAGFPFPAWTGEVDITRTNYNVIGDIGISFFNPSPLLGTGTAGDGHLIVVASSSTLGMSIGAYARLDGCFGTNGDRQDMSQANPNRVIIDTLRGIYGPVPGVAGNGEDGNYGMQIQFANFSRVQRKQGWVGNRMWFAVGQTANEVEGYLKPLASTKLGYDPLPFFVPDFMNPETLSRDTAFDGGR